MAAHRGTVLWCGVLAVMAALGMINLIYGLLREIGWNEIWNVFQLGAATMLRILIT